MSLRAVASPRATPLYFEGRAAGRLARPLRRGWRVVFSSSSDLNRAGVQQSPSPRSTLASAAVLAAESLFATIFPGDCRLCGAALAEISRLPVCATCVAAAQRISGTTCTVCGEHIVSAHAEAEALCGLCRRVEMPFTRAVAYGSYDGALRDLIHLLKYEGVRPAATVLGRMLADAAEALPALDAPLVVPVPLHGARQRARGFNQAERIARAAAKARSARTGEVWPVMADVMRRTRPTDSQTGLTRHQRRENIRGAFAVVKKHAVKDRDVMVVDDVFTTGTTAAECARVLRRAGAARVFVATVARVLKADAAHASPESREASNQSEAMAARA